ncbi:M20/M25/M40 family metallo-hydrolase [Sphingomonas ginkgonis]|uniref:M20/M25/M40 family metallo-hydrolase n=1 Tax=Sphingomonas ginkgonis TaxID=2315330 RepID=A0A429VD85_9SPHN|nr:M20/M25/M40 family metallo-hydrolase [Sphingomonas ginkgonis]RST31792.1 M20/M25/M40 family metallo-hydrolase [Sphingomonas ginkgonis]
MILRRSLPALLCAGLSAPALAAPNPVAVPTKLDPAWQARARALYKAVIEVPSVSGRGLVPKVGDLLVKELTAGGIPASDIVRLPYKGVAGDQTQVVVARWRSPHPTKKPILVLGHMDVVEAKREDWKQDPFVFAERDGYFYGRGASDMKDGVVGTTMAVLKLKQSGFVPDRDIILFYSGDEETQGKGAELGATQWRKYTDAEFGLNADGSSGAFRRDGTPLGFSLTTSEKTFQTYFLTVRNRGGHSSRPRPDNAIYELADALKKLQNHRFTPMMNDTTKAYFTARSTQEKGALGDAMRRWVANPNDGQAADVIEASDTEVGLTRTRCVATMLKGGHADNALPQMAQATVNCRIFPGVQPSAVQAELQQTVGPNVEIVPDPNFIGVPTPASPLRPDVLKAFSDSVHRLHGASLMIIPSMSTGASDGSFFRAKGIPVYDVNGSWIISPEDERAHGLDERLPVSAFYDNVLHWENLLRALAS